MTPRKPTSSSVPSRDVPSPSRKNDRFVAAPADFASAPEYAAWIATVKETYRACQLKAAVKVNEALLSFYWWLGREIAERQAEQTWGSGVIERMSLDLRAEFPGTPGFSTTTLWYVKKWYLFYASAPEILHQPGGELPPLFASVPWKHHCEIVTRCKTVGTALFYLRETARAGWSRSSLLHALDGRFHEKKGQAVTNFAQTLPPARSDLARDVLKSPYDFGFLALDETYDERSLEEALTRQITRFLLELGKGFSFYGRQVELVVSGTSYFVDMMFYHVRLKCFVVVELKVSEFKPEFAGKLNFYVTATDRLLKGKDDNPTIGLLICRSKDDTKVEWSFDGLRKPLGVAAYEGVKILPREWAEALPTAEQLASSLSAPTLPSPENEEQQ